MAGVLPIAVVFLICKCPGGNKLPMIDNYTLVLTSENMSTAKWDKPCLAYAFLRFPTRPRRCQREKKPKR